MWAKFNPKQAWQCKGCLSPALSLQMGMQVWQVEQHQQRFVFKFLTAYASLQMKQAHLTEIQFYQRYASSQICLPHQTVHLSQLEVVDGLLQTLQIDGLSEILVLPYVRVLSQVSEQGYALSPESNLSKHDLLEKITDFQKICNQVEYLHHLGYVHGDLKPQHIFFDAAQVGLLDFAQLQSIDENSGVMKKGGTPAYMAPELFLGQSKSVRSDLYALGIIFYYLLMGYKPYQAKTYQQWAVVHCQQGIPELPLQYQAYQRVLDGLLAKRLENRFECAKSLINALNSIKES